MEDLDRICRLTDEINTYRFEDRDKLKQKKLIALLGPSAVGKSTIIHRALELAQKRGMDAAEAGTSTTRAPRPDDPEAYHTGIPMDDMLDMIENKQVVNWSLMNTGQIYATRPEDFTAEYNFMACLPASLSMLRVAGFAAIHAFYIVTDEESWEEQLKPRRFEADGKTLKPDFGARMDEALESLAAGRRNWHQITPVESKFGDAEITHTATMILDASNRPTHTYEGLEIAENSKNSLPRFNEMYNLAIEMAQDFEDKHLQESK